MSNEPVIDAFAPVFHPFSELIEYIKKEHPTDADSIECYLQETYSDILKICHFRWVDAYRKYNYVNNKTTINYVFNVVSLRGFPANLVISLTKNSTDKETLDVIWGIGQSSRTSYYQNIYKIQIKAPLSDITISPAHIELKVKADIRCITREGGPYSSPDTKITYLPIKEEPEIFLTNSKQHVNSRHMPVPGDVANDVLGLFCNLPVMWDVDIKRSWVGDPLKEYLMAQGVSGTISCNLDKELIDKDFRRDIMRDAWKFFSKLRTNVIGFYYDQVPIRVNQHADSEKLQVKYPHLIIDSQLFKILIGSIRPKEVTKSRQTRRMKRQGRSLQTYTQIINEVIHRDIFMLITKTSKGKWEIYSDSLGQVSPTRYGAPTCLRYVIKKHQALGDLSQYLSLSDSVTIDEVIEATHELELMKALT